MDKEEFNKEWQRICEAKSDTNSQLIKQLADKVEKIAELEKENAELKDNFKIAKDNEYEYLSLLTKAKEIIRQFLNDYLVITKELLDKLEQFVSEVEK